MKSKLFALLMLVSGFAGISYEILYGRILGNLIGDQFAVSAAILITFLFGIGMGSRYAWRLWPHLWFIEGAIGLCGAIFALGANALDGLLYEGLPLLPDGLSGSILACALLLVGPAFLIGCSVPLFAGYMNRIHSAPAFSRVYALYNIGAALTALLMEYLLIRWLGIRGATLGFALLNLFIAVVLKFGFGSIGAAGSAIQSVSNNISRRQWLALIPVSMASAVFQLLMVKLAEMILGPFRESFALVLSITLLGIAVGAILVRKFRLEFAGALVLALTGLLLLLAGLEPIGYLYAALYDPAAESYFLSVLLKLACLTLMMGLPAIAFGATVPALLREEGANVSRDSGQLLFIASMANVAGFLLMVFLLHRFLDYGVQLLVIALLATASMLVYAEQQRLKQIVAACCLLLASGAAYQLQWDEDLLYISYTNFRSVKNLASARNTFRFPQKYKGYQDVFSINWIDDKPYFFINGYTSIPLSNPSEKVVGALSSIYAANAEEALVLGLGSGATASVVGHLFKHTDVVEINPVVRENLFRMRRWNFDIETNPRVNIVVDDAIHFTKAANKAYDLILNTVTTPLYFSSAKLYTRDFLQVIKKRLRPEGIYVTWMDSRVGDQGVGIILNTIADSFRYCALLYVKSAYFLLICSDQPIVARQAELLNGNHFLHKKFMEEHGILTDWLKYQLLNRQVLDLNPDPSQPLNEADYPALEFEMAKLKGRGIPRFQAGLYQAMDIDELRGGLGEVPEEFPADLVRQAKFALSNSTITQTWEGLARTGSDDYEQQDFRARQLYYRKMTSITDSADGYHKFGYQLMREKKYHEALEVFSLVLEKDVKHNNTYFNMAACYEYLNNLPEALVYYRKEAEVDPDDKDVPYRLGRVYVKMKRYQEALEYLQVAIEKMGSAASPQVYSYLGMAFEGLGRADEAQAAFEKARAKRAPKVQKLL